jgi:hypothetical protein
VVVVPVTVVAVTSVCVIVGKAVRLKKVAVVFATGIVKFDIVVADVFVVAVIVVVCMPAQVAGHSNDITGCWQE